MKQFLLTCIVLLCIANVGYSQKGAENSLPPARDIQSPTPTCPIGIDKNHPVVLVWFTTTYGNVTVKVINSAGATITKSINAVNGTSLIVDVSGWGQTYYNVYVINKLGMVIAKF